MFALVKRIALAAEDRLKYSPLVRGALSRAQRWRVPAANGDQEVLVRGIQRLCTAARFARSVAAVRDLQQAIHQRLSLILPRRINWPAFAPNSVSARIRRCALVKPFIGPREKGVLFVSFESEWFKLLTHADLREFAERYTLVVAPSGSPHNLLNYVFTAAYPGKIFTLISNAGDPEVLPAVGNNLVVVPLYASHWALPDLFRPLPRGERDVDLVMVANFAKFKRHFALFQALRRMPRRLRVLLVGQDQDGRTADTIRREAAYYGVDDRFTVRSNLSYGEVTAALCRSRASTVLSRREGSCVVIAESLFADAPAALLAAAEIGSRAFIHPATGKFLHDGRVADELTELVERASDYRPREWAEANISCFRSTAALNDILRRHALADGGEWTCDLAPLCWRPDPALVHPSDGDKMAVSRDDLRNRFNIVLGPGPE
jgi:glycosyltransferase involved in cell wall biosynthesis